MTRDLAPMRVCPVCEHEFKDRGAGTRSIPRDVCSKRCADQRKRDRANARAARRGVPPRAPRRLFAATSPSSRDFDEMRAKVDAEGRCRRCGCVAGSRSWRLEAAHIIPRSLAPNGGETADNCIPLCRGAIDPNAGCHPRYDKGELDILPWLTVEEQAMAVTLAGGLVGALRVTTGQREIAA